MGIHIINDLMTNISLLSFPGSISEASNRQIVLLLNPRVIPFNDDCFSMR